jgi:phage shock protein PspC (stress-responsive transcriptional regulator)
VPPQAILDNMSAERIASNLEDTVRDFWTTRPRRSRRGRMIAGVAVGIGRRYGVDPVIIRVVFAVSAVYGGAGVLFYLLGWLLLPGETDEVSAAEALVNRGRSSTSALLTVLLFLALIPASSFVLGGPVSTVVGAVMVLVALYLLHRARSGYRPNVSPAETHLGQGIPGSVPDGGPGDHPGGVADGGPGDHPGRPGGGPADGPEKGAEPGTVSGSPEGPGSANMGPPTGAHRGGEPPAWDPLGAAPFAWDLSDPIPPSTDPPTNRRPPRIGWATVGAVLVISGGIALAAPHFGWLGFRHDIGLVLAVLGLGMVAASFVRGGRGLLGPALVLSLIGLVAPLNDMHATPITGNTGYEPTTISAVQPTYQHSVGNMIVDLSRLTGVGTVNTSISEGAGNLTVRVPEDATVHALCHTNVGTVNCLSGHAEGPNATTQADQTGNDGLTIVMTANNGAGNVEVTHG